MAFKASDYPEIRKASDKYNVAKSDFQKLDRQLTETPTSSPNYQSLLKRRNEAKFASEKALELYQGLVEKRKSQYEAQQQTDKYTNMLRTGKRRLEVLRDDLQRAKDRGDSTTAIEKAIADIEKNTAEAEAGLAGIGKNKRPTGVPKDAKFNTVTGNWESGTQKWDTKGQAVTDITTKPVAGAKGGTPTKGTMPTIPTGGPTGEGIAAGSGFDPARFRMGEEASMGATKPVVPTAVTKTPFEKIMAEAVKLYGGIDEIFAENEELKNLLIRSIGDPTTAKDDMDEDQFINLLQNTTWYKTNSGPIRQRGFEKRQYDALVKKLKTDDPQYKAKIEELNRTSAYGRGLQDVVELLRENATKLGRQISDDDLRVIAAGIYDYANEDDAVKIRNAILGAGTFGAGKRNTAKAGLPDRVASLLDQGVDLETIYSPYKRIMAATLELSPESITLNDPTLRMGIGPDKEVSLYEYQRMLRKDPRWQYTNNAREDVANSVLTVARNFGFQG